MLLGLFKKCVLSENSFKNMEIHSFRGPFLRFPVHFVESAKKAEFQTSFGASTLNEEQRSITLQTKNFPTRLLIHRYVEFSQNVDWKMMAIISLKLRNPGFKIFIESGFWMIIIA